MSQKFEVGTIVEGTVVKIKPFGAIVSLDGNSQGLVHISQVSNSFVQNINDHLKIGDLVKVKILSIDNENRKISLSIRDALPVEKNINRNKKNDDNRSASDNKHSNSETKHYQNDNRHSQSEESQHTYSRVKHTESGATFDDKLKDWIKQSNERQAGLNKRNNRR